MDLSTENFHEAFHGLTRLLSEHRSLWAESAFVSDDLAWRVAYPELHAELLALSDEAVATLSDEDALLARLSSHIPELQVVADWRIASPDQPRWQTPQKALFGLPERKRRQTEGFVTALSPLLARTDAETAQGKGIVDWCSGRGLLARQLYYAGGIPVRCLERDGDLCRSGHHANKKMDTDMARRVSFSVQDVLGSIDRELLEHSYLHSALHACGDLHVAMLQQATNVRARAIACSPCCYHLMEGEFYLGLSLEGRRSGLNPSKEHLRLATAETWTANGLERELRHRELLWRIAFDLHLRDLSGIDQYRSMPSVKKSLLKSGFAKFHRSMMEVVQKKGAPVSKPSSLSPDEQRALLSRAQKKMATIVRLEKAQLGFRKALEYWLLLDRALFLQEQGYRVELLEFCSKQDSGRNTLIVGLLET